MNIDIEKLKTAVENIEEECTSYADDLQSHTSTYSYGAGVLKGMALSQKHIKIAINSAVSGQEIHLCNDCEYGCMAACPITKNVKFGNGQGNDNVIECENYINKEALNKWRINKIISRGDEQ